METLYLLIGLTLVILVIIAVIFLWAVRSGQFDDLEGPAHDVLFDDRGGDRKPNMKTSGDSARDDH